MNLNYSNRIEEYERKKEKLGKYKSKLSEMELKHQRQQDQNLELNKTLLLVFVEIERLSDALEKEREQLRKPVFDENERLKYLEAVDDLELWKAKCSRLELELTSKSNELEFKNKDYNGRIGILQSEVARFVRLLKEKIK